MRTPTVDQMKIGLVLSLSLIGGGFYRYAQLESQVRFNTQSIASMDSKLDLILANLASTRTDIEVIKTKVQGMERPIYHTNEIAKSLKRDVAMFKLGPAYARPFYQGPYGAR